MRSKVVTREEALKVFKDGQTIMFGDWHGELSAEEIITGMLEIGVKDIDAIAVSIRGESFLIFAFAVVMIRFNISSAH